MAAPKPPILELTIDARAEWVAHARHTVAAFVRDLGFFDAGGVELALSEVITNAVVHAFRDTEPGVIRVRAYLCNGGLELLVADDGAGLRPRSDSPGTGLGLSLVAQLADSVDFDTPPSGGTSVRLTFRRNHHRR